MRQDVCLNLTCRCLAFLVVLLWLLPLMCPPPPCFFKRNDVLRNTNGVIINQLRSCFLLLVLWTTMPADSLQREMERERTQEQRQGRQGRQGRRANTALPLLLLSAVALLGLGLGLGPLALLALL